MNRYKFSFRVYEYYSEAQYNGNKVFFTDRTDKVYAKNVAEAVLFLYNEFLVLKHSYYNAISDVKLLKTRRC